MRTQVIANSTMHYASCDGQKRITHCLMAIDEPTASVSRADYTFYLWEWDETTDKNMVDAEIDEINRLSGCGHIHPSIIFRLTDDMNLYGKRNYSPLDNISLNFKFQGWERINTDMYDSSTSIRKQIDSYIKHGKHRIAKTRRRNRTNSM